jgi:hypothetical protein
MTDSATSRYKARQQSQGSNTNQWGDDKLNEVLRLLDRGSKGYQALALTGDTTLSWTNYVATNDGQVSILKLTGSLSSAAALTVPSAEWTWDLVWNTTGQTVTMKTSSGTGVAIPNGRKVKVFCDASDCYFSVPNYLGDAITESNNRDLMDYAAVSAAIATAGLPATNGTVLNSTTATVANYLDQLIALSGNLALSKQNGGTSSEKSLITHTPYWSTPRNITNASSPVTALDKDILLVQTSTGAVSVTLPASGRIQITDVSGSASSNNITVTPPSGDSIASGSADETMLIDTAWFSSTFTRRPSGTNWSLS